MSNLFNPRDSFIHLRSIKYLLYLRIVPNLSTASLFFCTAVRHPSNTASNNLLYIFYLNLLTRQFIFLDYFVTVAIALNIRCFFFLNRIVET